MHAAALSARRGIGEEPRRERDRSVPMKPPTPRGRRESAAPVRVRVLRARRTRSGLVRLGLAGKLPGVDPRRRTPSAIRDARGTSSVKAVPARPTPLRRTRPQLGTCSAADVVVPLAARRLTLRETRRTSSRAGRCPTLPNIGPGLRRFDVHDLERRLPARPDNDDGLTLFVSHDRLAQPETGSRACSPSR